MKTFLLIMMLSVCPHHSICVANLKYFETLSHIGVTSSIKRSSDGTRDLMKHVQFNSFGRDFDLTLKPGTHLMAEGFQARLIHEDGSSSYFDIDQSQIFSGYLTDRPDVRVHAHTEDTLWLIQIFDKEDIFVIEPAWRLLNQTENPKNDTMIAYRASDLSFDSFNGSTFCGVHDHENVETPTPRMETRIHQLNDKEGANNKSAKEKEKNTRGRRDVLEPVCVLFLVGDYTFYKGKCNGNYRACSALMFAYAHLADVIFRSTVFEDYTDTGLLIGQIVLYSTYTIPKTNNYPFTHFNEKWDWTIHKKLDAFSIYASYMAYDKEYCLYHLFSDYPFPDRILGLAWLASLCYEAPAGYSQRNSGVSSGTDNLEGPISTLQMNLVFAHELGHNFGSEHDPQTEECSRPDNEGGNFLMWPRAVSGKLPNHLKFSPCSRRHIGRVLELRTCLLSRNSVNTFCGNGVVEKGEECDAGALGLINTDLCCSRECSLNIGATCSEMNQACCKNCSMAPAGTKCASSDLAECKKASYCNGNSFVCPDPMPVADWQNCRENGQCYRGICRSFCEIKSIKEGLNLKGCMCRTNDSNDACKWCCFDATLPSNPGPCVVYSNATVQDGRQCYLGFCKAGLCESHTVSTIRRLYHYLPALNPSELLKFMRGNIVLCVIVLSLFLWLPPVYYINKADEREKEEHKRSSSKVIAETLQYINQELRNKIKEGQEIDVGAIIRQRLSRKSLFRSDEENITNSGDVDTP